MPIPLKISTEFERWVLVVMYESLMRLRIADVRRARCLTASSKPIGLKDVRTCWAQTAKEHSAHQVKQENEAQKKPRAPGDDRTETWRSESRKPSTMYESG